ncbi:SRPBCC family protein [Streptomyces sp. NPDC047928]|uniref:SRPBCC family protein n=1 Tax=unclassified Streptomyces TaxID=2593676 RepID=UPI0037102E7B
MDTADPVVVPGTSESHGDTHVLRFVVRLPHPEERVWPAVASRDGLPRWLAAVDVFEPRLGGAVALRWLTDPKTAVTGTVTAWDVERVAEYTLALHGRVRFHLEPGGPGATVVRFTNEVRGSDALRLDCLAGWHDHFGLLADALDGRPADWSRWTPDHWRELRERYAAADADERARTGTSGT